MFDDPFVFFALAIAIVALIFARKAMNQVAELRDAAGGDRRRRRPPPRPCLRRSRRLRRSSRPCRRPRPGSHRTPPPIVPDAESIAPAAPAETAEQAAGGAAAPPPPLPQPDRGFEETIGTRWVVWIGGLTLALGGFFMVRYSIEAGLLGPGVRTMLGGLFALALLLAGEWTRRKESISAIAALPIANIPAILTAAGTAVAFATVYAAYALYGFLVPATAFILLGLVALGTLAAALLHGPALAGLGVVGAFVTPVLVSSGKPDFWALYIYLAIVTAAAFGLARVRLWRWLAVTTIAFALLWTFPCLQCGPSMVGPHAFHVLAGFILAALLVVCGFMFGPPADEGQVEPISSGSLAAYLLGATLDRAEQFSCRHRDDRVRPAGGRQSPGRLAQRCRRRRGRGRRCAGVRRIRRMGRSRQSRHAGAARRPVAGHRAERHGRIGVAAPDIGRDLRRGLWRGGIPRAGPLRRAGHTGDLVGRGGVHAAGAAGRALRPHRASRPLDPVCDSRGRARRGLCRRDRDPLPSAKTVRDCRPRSRCLRPARSPRWRWR